MKPRAKSQISENYDRHIINLYRGDWEWLQSVYGGKPGAGVVIREMLRSYRTKVEKKAVLPSVNELEVIMEDMKI